MYSPLFPPDPLYVPLLLARLWHDLGTASTHAHRSTYVRTMAGRRRFGSVRKLPSGRYQVRYRDLSGRQHTAPLTFATKRDAERWLSVTEADLLRDEWIDPRLARITYGEWAADYLAHSAYKRATTRVRDRSAINRHLIPALGHLPLGGITPLDVRRLLGELQAKGLAPNTIRAIAGTLRTTLNAAIDAELITTNPCRKMRLPPKTRTDIRVVTPAELNQLADAINDRYTPIPYLAGVLGLRWSEIAGLRVGRLDLLRRQLTIAETLAQVGGFAPTKNASSRRTLVLPRFLADLLANHLAHHDLDASQPNAVVFTAPRGGRLWANNFHRDIWKPATHRAGLPGLTIHALRHSSVALAIDEGAHARQIQERLGHSSITTTMDVYGHVLASSDEDLAHQLNDRFQHPDVTEQQVPRQRRSP